MSGLGIFLCGFSCGVLFTVAFALTYLSGD